MGLLGGRPGTLVLYKKTGVGGGDAGSGVTGAAPGVQGEQKGEIWILILNLGERRLGLELGFAR